MICFCANRRSKRITYSSMMQVSQKTGAYMTNTKRTTVSFPDELTERIFALRKDDRFTRCSYSEPIRLLAEKGLSMLDPEHSKDSA